MAAATKAKRKHGRPKKKTVICGARKRDGTVCLLRAGQGTEHLGVGRCSYHGGLSPSGEIAGAKHTESIEVDPVTAIQGVLWKQAGLLAWGTSKLAEIEEASVIAEDGTEHRWLRFVNRTSDRVAKYASIAAQMGVDLARLRLMEAQTAMMGRFIEGVLERLDLNADQRKKVGPAIRAELAAVEDTASQEVERV